MVHKGAIDNFAAALHYNTSEVKWRYIGKMMEKLQQNESIISVCSILKKFLQQLPEGDINKIRNPPNEENVDELGFPKTRIEMISKLDKDYALMNELMSLNIEFKRSTLDLIYDHLGRNVDREQSLETQSSLSSSNDAEGEDTEEEEVQTDAASRPSQQLSNNGNDENEDNDENDIEMKSSSKPQALSEDDGFIVPKKREVRNNMLSGRNSNIEDEEQKDNKRGANQSLSITDISMTDEDNKEKDLERRYISKRSHSVSHRDPRNRNAIPESPVQNYRENDFILNVETNTIYEMKYFKEVSERLEFLKYILKNGDEIIKPIHLKILWECHIESSFHEKERAIFFEWCSSIIKIQAGYANTRKESVTIFDDDTIELIFFESLLCLDFSTLPEEAYDCFEEYFVYINAQFGQLIRGSFSGSYEVFETKLIGIQALWEIVLQAKDQKVHQKASKFLMTLYKKLSPDLINNLNTIKEEFLKTCMSHIKDGVKALKEGVSTEDKENGKNRVARSLDQICKFIDEFEGLKDRSKKTAADSAPKITVKFNNQMGLDYQPKKGELQVSKMTTIKDLKTKLCEAITPHPNDYELTLIYKGRDLSSQDLKTLSDHKYEEGGIILITKRTFFEDCYTDDFGFGQAEVNEKELETHMETIRAFGIECEDEVIKLALKKNQLKIEETILMLTSDAVENLRKEVADMEEQNTFVPIITKEEKEEDKKNEEDEKEEESKLNLILSNKSEYFDLLFDLLNLGVNEINIQAWNLLTQIPVNKKLYSNIKKLDISKKEDWNALMDPLNMYKLLYSLQIINSLICSPDNDNVDDVELQERYEWRLRFLKQGGFEHLVTILLSQNNIEDSLKMQRRSRGGRKKNKSEDMGKSKIYFRPYLNFYSKLLDS